jgi:hypothetical protein
MLTEESRKIEFLSAKDEEGELEQGANLVNMRKVQLCSRLLIVSA